MNLEVVIPLYNKAPWIQRAIDSVLDQTVPARGVVVVDDGSTDSGPRLVQGYGDSRVRLISQENAGVSAARNLGVRSCVSDYVALLDADDYWFPWFIEEAQVLCETFPGAVLYGVGYEFEDVHTRSRKRPRLQSHLTDSNWKGRIGNYFQVAQSGFSPITASSAVIDRRVFLSLGGFSTDVQRGEDQELWARLALMGPVAASGRVCSVYVKGIIGGSSSPAGLLDLVKVANRLTAANSNAPTSPDSNEALARFSTNIRTFAASESIRLGLPNLGFKLLLDYRNKGHLLRRTWWMLRAVSAATIQRFRGGRDA